MSRLRWQTDRTLDYQGLSLPVAPNLQVVVGPQAGRNQVGGIRPNSAKQRRLKQIIWPLNRLHNELFVTGFLQRAIARWMRQRFAEDTVFLEVGAGEMSLRRDLPQRYAYNAIDIAYSEFALRRVLASRDHDRINLALASATDIPLADGSVAMVASKEVMMYIPDVSAALREIRRVCRPAAAFMCTIGNLYSRKYARKGWQGSFTTPMTFEQFRQAGEAAGFRCIEARQCGWWVPLPAWITTATHQLPITSRREEDNTNFLYLFEAA